MSTKSITRLALLTAVALALGYCEQFIPMVPGVPGMKLGLANVVLLYALYVLDTKSAILLMVLKVLLSGLLYAGFFAMLFSLGGGILSLGAMVLLRRLWGEKVSVLGVSVAGAVAHNGGQLLVAAFLGIYGKALLVYVPVLLLTGVATGVLTGWVAKYAIRAIQKADCPGGTPPHEGGGL